MPQRAETVTGFVQGMHQYWLAQQARAHGHRAGRAGRCRDALPLQPRRAQPAAMVPAVIPLLLLMLPAMLTALAVVREKELGSIINLTSRRPRGWSSCSASSCPTWRWRLLNFT